MSNIINDIVAYALDEALVDNYYLFQVPPLSVVGNGSSVKIGEHIKKYNAKKIFIVTDEQIVNLNLLSPMLRALKKNNIDYEIFDKILPDPTDTVVLEGVEKYKTTGCDFIAGFGGGSPIDAAKAIALLATNDIDIEDCSDESKITNMRVPLAAIPTTAGTGSEVTDVSVISITSKHIKLVIKHPYMIPDMALIDPYLTIGIPPAVTAATGLDVLTHAIEAYVARSSCTLARALSHRAIHLVSKYLPTAVGYGSNIIARHKMAVACYMAGMAFSNAGLGLCHAMAHQIGAKYKVPHGVANALLLPHIMRFNLSTRRERFLDIAVAMGEKIERLSARDAAMKSVEAVENLLEDVSLPRKLRDVGALQSDFKMLAEWALKDITIKTNPRSANINDIIKIYENAY